MSEIELSRPVGRYELISTDIKAFKNKVENGIIGGKSFTARIRYAGYVATGFNVLEQTPKNMLNFLSYKTALNFKASDMEEMCIGFDYIMCRNLDFSLPLDLEVMDENGVVVSTTALSIPVMAVIIQPSEDVFLLIQVMAALSLMVITTALLISI